LFERDERFNAIELATSQLPEFFNELHQCNRICLNVTSPYKEDIIEYLNELSGDAIDAHAVNIIVGGSGTLMGYNADIEGFRSPSSFLTEIKTKNEERGILPAALILGSGGASAAAAVGLMRTWGDGNVVFLARNRERLLRRVAHLQEHFAGSPMKFTAADSTEDALEKVFRPKETAALLVNTTPIGQWPDAGDKPFVSFGLGDEELAGFKYYYDAVYNPLRTAGMKYMEGSGAITAGGVDWYCRQAVRSAELFFGKRPSEDEVRRFVEYELKRV
jgi:shikimate dehydrogenase